MKFTRFLAAVATIGAACTLPGCTGNSSEHFADVDLIPVQLDKDSKWSMVNDKGEIVYDSEFAERPSMSVNGYFSVKEGEGYTLYKAEKVPEAVEGLEKLKYIGYVQDGLIPVTKPDCRITVMKPSGQTAFELTPHKGSEIVRCAAGFNDGMLRILTEEDKFGYCDKSGNVTVDPVYDRAYDFSNGLAVVGKSHENSDGDTETDFSVIDKNGKQVFKIKSGLSLERFDFSNGYLLLSDDGRNIVCDRNGEMKKLPSKIETISDANDKYIIFHTDNGYGACDLEGEIIIRPKYDYLTFAKDGDFFARKDRSDDEIILLDNKGEQKGNALDYEYIFDAGHFGYFASDDKTVMMLDNDLKAKCKDEFYGISTSFSACYLSIESDYFDMTGAANNMVSLIKGDKVGDLRLGAKASTVANDEQPSYYTNRSSIEMPQLSKDFYRYSISVSADFTENLGKGEWDSSTYTYDYYWNPDAKLGFISIEMKCTNEWGDKGQKLLIETLEKDGYKMLKKATDKNIALLKKGSVLVMVESQENYGALIVVDGSLPGIEPRLMAELSGEPYEEDVVVEAVAEAVEVDSLAY